MKILVSGCSFTEGKWPHYLANLGYITNVAKAGFGNQYISDSIVINHAIDHTFDLTLVMWSGLTRRDAVVENNPLFNDYFFKTEQQQLYIASGGICGSWGSNKTAIELFNPQYKFTSDEQLIYLSLLDMIKTQRFLETLNKPYYMMSYVNYWNMPVGQRSPNMDIGISQFANLEVLVNMIDFKKWIFLNSNKDGIYELAKQNSCLADDNYHPSDEANKEWANIVRERLRKDSVI